THDIDILVKGGRNFSRAVKTLSDLYPALEVRQLTKLTVYFVPGERYSVIDVSYPNRADNAETLAKAIWTEDVKTGIRYRIPSLEEALTNKYGAMLALTRDVPKRQQDAVDFGWMVVHSTDEGQK